MLKLLSVVLVATTFLFDFAERPKPAAAQSCVAATSCGPRPVQFVPGERLTVEVVNLTASVVELEQVLGTDPLPISPGQMLSLVGGENTDANFSVVFWDVIGLPLKVNISQPEARTLRIEVRPGGRPPSDRTVYVKDDGRVAVF